MEPETLQDVDEKTDTEIDEDADPLDVGGEQSSFMNRADTQHGTDKGLRNNTNSDKSVATELNEEPQLEVPVEVEINGLERVPEDPELTASMAMTRVSSCDIQQDTPPVVSEQLRDIWRCSMVDARGIQIRHTSKVTRPMKTMNAFVTKITVFLAYLIVHAEDGKPFPNVTKRFELDNRKHNFAAMEEEILKSRFNYTGHWNRFIDPHTHIACNSTIGTWLANCVNKARYHGTWYIGEDGDIKGAKEGLYQPYKEFLEKIGVRFHYKKNKKVGEP